MNDSGVTAFGGIVGRVLRDATSIGTAVTAFILGAVVVMVSFIFTFIGNAALAQFLVQGVVALALARFALNGLAGEFRGTILSTAGGSWIQALMVAARYLVLNMIWMAPTCFALWLAVSSARLAAEAARSDNTWMKLPIFWILTSKAVIASVILLLLGLTVLPPLFLIIAVRAESLGHVFSPEHWRRTFAGRFADLYVIYAIHGGGVGMMIIMAIPLVLLGFSAASEFGIFFMSVAFAYMCSLAVTLLGRLCGFFAFDEESTNPVYSATPEAAGFAPRVVQGGVAGSGLAGTAVAGTVVAGMAVAGTGIAAAGAETASAHHAVAVGPVAVPPVIPDETIDDSGRPPLPDAAERAAAARIRFATDRDGALEELQALHAQHAPSPPIAHALALSLHEAGQAAEALDMARQAMPLCIARGQVPLAADLFATFWKQARDLGLDHEQIDAVASSFMKAGNLSRAVSAYGLALTMDTTDRKAIKGLLQAADQRLHKEGRPKDAAKIYTFLLQYAPNSSFAEDMRNGLAEAESRLARAS